MAHIQYRTRGERLSRGVAQVLLTTAALAAITTSAHADVCFPTPVALPGLSGVPLWKGNGVLRAELNEPRWAAAPLTWFASDPTGADGLYRIMVDSAYSELSVSFQAPTDLGSVSNADVHLFRLHDGRRCRRAQPRESLYRPTILERWTLRTPRSYSSTPMTAACGARL